MAFDINESTLADWLFYWEHGIKRKLKSQKIENDSYKRKKIVKKTFSPELKDMMRRNTEKNDKKVKYINKNDNTIMTRGEYFKEEEGKDGIQEENHN